MSQYAREHMVLPAWELSHFVVVHAQFGFGLLEALLDGPAQTAEPTKRL